MIDYRVYLVTDEPSRYRGNWLDNVREAVEGGVTCVQYRDTQSHAREQLARVRALMDALAATGVPVVVNNDVALALAAGAAGVHVGRRDLPPEAVRRIAGNRLEIGYSITSLADWRSGEATFADVIGIGPVWDAVKTKADATAALGIAGLKEILAETGDKPNVVIGGITLERAREAARAGAGGVAAVSMFSKAADPRAAARALRALF